MAAADTQAPNAISTLAASTPTQTSSLLSWSAPADLPGGGAVASYDLRYTTATTLTAANWGSATLTTGEPAPAAPGTAQSYTLAGLAAGTSYRVAMTASDAAGNVAPISNVVVVTTAGTPTPPPPPADTTAPTLSAITAGSITTTGATISWNTNEAADTQVDIGLTSSYGQSSTLSTTLETTHSQTLSGLTSGTLYHYRVKSKDAAGNLAVSGDNTVTTLTPPDTTAPSAPLSLVATPVSTTQINLGWSASTDNVGVIGYRIYRAGTLLGSSSAPSYTATGLTSATLYSFTVAAYDAAGNSSTQSASVSATTQAVVVVDVTAPTLTGASVTTSANALTFAWTTNELADGKVLYGTAANALTQSQSTQSLTLTHSLGATNLTRRTTYFYQLVSKDAAGNSASSVVASIVTSSGKTSSLTNLQAVNGSVVLSWSKSIDPFAQSVVIYRGTSAYPTANDTAALLATLPDVNTLSYRDSAVTSGTTYYYSLYTLDDQGTLSDPAQITFTPSVVAPAPAPTPRPAPASGGGGGGGGGSVYIPPLAAPAVPRALGAPDQIVLSWKNPVAGDFVRTRVIRKADSDPQNVSDGTVIYEGTGEQFTDTTASSSITYHYAIVALNQSLTPGIFARVQAKLGDRSAGEVMGALAQLSTSTTAVVTPTGLVLILSKDLKRGMTDAEVTRLQSFLQSLGYLPASVTPTGYFGGATQAAVIKYQRAKAITPAAGLVGPTTRKFLGGGSTAPTATTGSKITRVLIYGMQGADVLLLQQLLQSKNYLGKSITPNGSFGPVTLIAVKQLQCAMLKVCSGTPASTGYGSVGGRTRTALGL